MSLPGVRMKVNSKLMLSLTHFTFLTEGLPTKDIFVIISASILLQLFFGNCPF